MRLLFFKKIIFLFIFSGLVGSQVLAKVQKDLDQDKLSLLEQTSKMRTETRYIVYSMEQLHYDSSPINDLDTDAFLESYISDLDLNRLFLYASDVDGIKERFSKILPVYLRQQGNLYPAFEIFRLFRDRALARLTWVDQRLSQPFDFTEEVNYSPDRKDAPWPKTKAQADDLWEKRLKYELLNELLIYEDKDKEVEANTSDKSGKAKEEVKEKTMSFEERLEEAVVNLKKRYERFAQSLKEIESYEVQEIFLTSLTHMYDPHSTFLSADSLEEFSIMIKNSLVGIGAMLYVEDGYCTIRELIPGGPAEKSKQLKPTDKIVGVAQGEDEPMQDVIGMRLKNIVKLIRGKQGTTVRLLIQPADEDPSKRKEVSLKREEIKLTSNLAKSKLFHVPHKGEDVLVGVIDLPTFYGSEENEATGNNTSDDVKSLINKLKQLGAQGIILDLRRNGGGLLDEAIELAGLFIPTGPVLQVQDTVGQLTDYRDNNPEIVWDGPMIVLVSRYSASASEIVAGALKNHERALIVGDEATHGKGTVQGVFEMDRSLFGKVSKPQMGAAKITIQKWYLPDGTSTQARGVPSDITMPSINMFLPIAETDLPHYMPWDSISPLDWELPDASLVYQAPVKQDIVQKLKVYSERRQHSLDEFKYLNASIDWLKEKQNQKVYSLNINERKRQRAQDELFKEKMDAWLERLKSQGFTASDVLLDVALKEEQEKKKQQLPKIPVDPNEADEDEEALNFDVYLRESLRIMADWVDLLKSDNQKVSIAKNGDSKPEINKN